jgi:hypothetical protein
MAYVCSHNSRFVLTTAGQRLTRGVGTSDPAEQTFSPLSGVANPNGKDGGHYMGDTYSSASEAYADRVQQKHLLAALNTWDVSMQQKGIDRRYS